MMWWITVSILVLLPVFTIARLECSKTEYDRCVRIADPLVKEAHLVFPDNLDDIDQVCRTWNRFVDCLKAYTEECFTEQQRRTFNRAVESPIESVHQMCMQPSYQKEYLQYAPCIKNTIIQRIHCGDHYNLLVDQVDQGDIISKSTLCCSYDRFKHCVQSETRRLCDRGVQDGPASRFAVQIIDKALRFLQDQCLNYIPSSGDCTNTETTMQYSGRSEPSLISTASSDVYPWSTIQQDSNVREVKPSQNDLPKVSTTAWLPSSELPIANNAENSAGSGSTYSTSQLGSRSRPSSYGRSNAWGEPSSSTTLGNTVPMYPETSTKSSIQQNWPTVSSWNGMLEGQNAPGIYSTKNPEYPTISNNHGTAPSPWKPSVTPSAETWYPAAGNQLNNEVDEPNQLGLRKPKRNKAESRRSSFIFVGISTIIGSILVLF